MITEDQVNDALQYLRDSAPKAAVARAQSRMLEKYLGVVEALQKAQQKALEGSVSNAAAQDAARGSPEYKNALEAWEEALRRDAEFTMLREAASARIDAWRSMEATKRAEERGYR